MMKKKLKYKWMQRLFGDYSRWLHFLLMAMIAFPLVHFIGFWVVVLGLVIGLVKEIYDKYYRHTFFDWWDVFWTFTGSVFAYLIYIVLT